MVSDVIRMYGIWGDKTGITTPSVKATRSESITAFMKVVQEPRKNWRNWKRKGFRCVGLYVKVWGGELD